MSACVDEINAIVELDRLAEYPFYFAALAELEQQLGRPDEARAHFLTASARARSPMERNFFDRRAHEVAS